MNIRRLILVLLLAAACGGWARASSLPDLGQYEGRNVASVELVFEGAPRDERAEADLRMLLTVAPDAPFAAARVRESLQKLFGSGKVQNARVEASLAGGGVAVRFVVRPQVKVGAVRVEFDAPPGAAFTEGDLRGRLNGLETGARFSEQLLATNADLIQTNLRDHGFYRATVTYAQELRPSGTDADITFRVSAGEQATVESLSVDVKGFDASAARAALKLQPGAAYSRATLADDIAALRQAVIAQGFLAPRIEERTQLDSQRNTVAVSLTGGTGPRVNVVLRGYELGEKKARELLPVRREGSIDQSAIVEGGRRLRNRLQSNGYFFARVRARCTVDAPPPAATVESVELEEEDEVDASCQGLNPDALSGRSVNIIYEVARGRRFRLTDIRIEGTDQLAVEDLEEELRTQTENPLKFIPVLGYGRGYTSEDALERDRRTVQTRMQELGYRRAVVTVRRGVSIDNDSLIITFAVNQGPLTRVASVEVRGNQIYDQKRLLDEPCAAASQRGETCTVTGAAYARGLARADAERIRSLYARNGYVDSEVNASIVELPKKGDDEQVKIVYDVKEGGKVFIDEIIVNGLVRTDKDAVLEALPLRVGAPLRLDELRESERILYNTNAFRQVIIRTEPHGETASGFRKHDVIIDVEELKPRRMDYGGGYSTDGGPLGLFEIYHNNLRGSLRQGAIRARANFLHQLVRFEFFDPRFRSYGQSKFSPLSVSLQYQRDAGVTRFFRSTIDRGTFGIVQRLNPEGNPIPVTCALPEDQCEQTGEPTINRFTFNVESQRVLDERSRTLLFVRYNYEDVRLFNISSLLLAPILQPDRGVRLSRLGTTLTRDTRDSQFDPTRGEFLSADFAVALRQLGGNLSFTKLLTTYRRYWRLGGGDERLPMPRSILERAGLGARLRSTVFAASATLGAANLFQPRDRDGLPGISDTDRTLPISERFFSGGSSTLRGFGFEEAGPRVAVCPGTTTTTAGVLNCAPGLFRNEQREQVRLNPFTVPVGGNAMAVVNFEARVPVRTDFQIVPFYDGGNVFRRVGDIFGRNDRRPGETLNQRNLRVAWSHTVGLGFRVKTPLGPVSIDYGFLLNPPEFEVPQFSGVPAIHRLKRTQIHFRFGQTF